MPVDGPAALLAHTILRHVDADAVPVPRRRGFRAPATRTGSDQGSVTHAPYRAFLHGHVHHRIRLLPRHAGHLTPSPVF